MQVLIFWKTIKLNIGENNWARLLSIIKKTSFLLGGAGTSDNGFMGATSCPASDDIDDKCCICKDFFEIFFYQEREEWHFKDAVRVDSKVYHPICLEDAREDNNSFTMPNISVSSSSPNLNSSMNSSMGDEAAVGPTLIKTEQQEATTEEMNNTHNNNNSADSTAFFTARETNNSQADGEDDSMNITNTTIEMMLMGCNSGDDEAGGGVSVRGSLVSDAYEDESCKDEPQTPWAGDGVL